MAKTIRCSIVTPTETLLEDDVTYATMPAWDGQQGVMAGASPVLTQLGYGALRLDFPEGGSRWFLLEGGFAQVTPDAVTLLTNGATAAEKLTVSEAEKAVEAANEAIKSEATNTKEAQQELQAAYSRLALARASVSRDRAI